MTIPMATTDPRVEVEPVSNILTTLRRDDENRAQHRARLSRDRIAAKKRRPHYYEGVADDLTTTTFHPTKGLRRISGKRAEANDRMNAIFAIARIRANGRRNVRKVA